MIISLDGSKQRFLGLAWAFALTAPMANANVPPDPGQVLRELTPEMVKPMKSSPLTVDTPDLSEAEPGGATVVVTKVEFEGNTLFSQQELELTIQEYMDRPLDFAGLRQMMNQVSFYYREKGYIFARAILPAQSIDSGSLRVRVVEGAYGDVSTSGHPDLYPDAVKFLGSLEPGAVIESRSLERHTLILSDQPGVEVVPVMKPGTEAGTGDLEVEVRRAERVSGEIGLDNHGNRFTGEGRLVSTVRSGSVFQLGDEFELTGLITEDDLFFGSFGYGLPLGGSGLRAFAEISYTDYELGKEFAALDITGRAQSREVGLYYPIIRSQGANITVRVAHQYKSFEDSQASSSTNHKSSYSLPVTIQFDVRDSIGDWGLTYGSLTGKYGKLYLDDGLEAFDLAGTNGSFRTLAYDLVRLQGLPGQFSMMARVAGQYTSSNVDSSEGMSLGGPNGVRAYPVGEASGDRGWFGQLEMRYRLGPVTPYLFTDYGEIRVNADDYDSSPNSRTLAGSGLGARFDRGPWHANVSVAWQTEGGPSVSSGKDESPLIWATGNYRF